MKIVRWLILLGMLFGAFHAVAQEPITYGEFGFDLIIAENVNIWHDTGENTMPPEAPNTTFYLYNQRPVNESLFEGAGAIRLYRIDDFGADQQAQLDQLTLLLEEKPDLTTFETLPFLPLVAAGQMIRARTEYIETAQVRGIGYMTGFREVAEPFLSHELVYTFQGISMDGRYYISAIFTLFVNVLPSSYPTVFNAEEFTANLDQYLQGITQDINKADEEAFSPSLATIESQIASFRFE